MTMKIGLLELYELVGENKGISFYYEELPGVIVSIGFTVEEELIEELKDDNEPAVH